jgi:SPP1 gp7 family putative phage head morphogenesis protein
MAEKPKRTRRAKVPGGEVAGTFNPNNLFPPYANWAGKKSFLRSYNPDDLVKSKGKSILIYQEMTREPFVKAALQQKTTMLLSVPWGVKPASNSAEHIEQAKFVTWNFKNISGGFARDVWEMCDAMVAGYSVQEKVYEEIIDGEYVGKVRLSALKSKDPYYFGFAFDPYMNLLPDGVIMTHSAANEMEVPLPSDKFFIFSFLKKYENLYGQSDLRSAYRAFWIKDTAWKLRSVYMERFSGNSLKGKYPRTGSPAQQAENRDKLIEIFKTWQNETGVAIPEDLEIEVLQIATSSDSEYARAMADCNVDIAVGILGETLTLNEGRKTGARNMGEIHKEVVDLFVLFLDMILTADINEQIVRDIIDTNYAGVTEYPEFYFYPREDYDPVSFGDAIQKWQAAGARISKAWFYEKVRMPLPSGPEDELKPVPVSTQFGVQSSEFGVKPTASAGSVNTPPSASSPDETGPDGTPSVKMGEVSPSPPERRGGDGYYREIDKFERFAEIPKVDLRLRRLTDKAIDVSRPAYEKIFAYVLKQVESKGVLESKDFTAAAKVAVNPAPLKDAIFRALITAHMMGRGDGVINMQNQGYDFGRIRKFAEVAFDWEVLDEPFTPEEAVKFFSGKVPMTREEFDALTDKLMSEAFYVTGLEKLNIEKDVKALLTDALKNGMDLKDFKFKLDELQVKYATPVYGREGTVGQSILDYHAETVFRTNMMSAYNEGRREMYSDPDVKAYFPAYEYTAIMDGRTSDICIGLDGKIYLADDPIWDSIWPPNHFNCRSTVVTVNKYDFNQDMISEPPTVLPAEGFGSFSEGGPQKRIISIPHNVGQGDSELIKAITALAERKPEPVHITLHQEPIQIGVDVKQDGKPAGARHSISTRKPDGSIETVTKIIPEVGNAT